MFEYLVPALIPSWRFFDYIAAAPRILAVVASAGDPAPCWQELRPRPAHLLFASMLWRLFWNPLWNESLYMVSCAEKLLADPSAMRADELMTRIAAEIVRGETGDKIAGPVWLTLRIVVFKREGEQIVQQVGFVSAPRRLDDAARRSGAA
jgi:hypothetical protein